MDRDKKLLLGGLGGLVIIAIFFVGSSGTGFLIGNCKTILENITEIVPYDDEICGDVPIVENQCQDLDYRYSSSKTCFADDSIFNIECILTNLEDSEGEFQISYGIIDKTGNRTGEEQTVVLSPKSSEIFRFSKDVGVGNCYCEIKSVPQKEVCFDVLKTQEKCYDITKYREVVTSRNITKCD